MTAAFLPAVDPETALFQRAFQRLVFPPLFPIAGHFGKSVILPPIAPRRGKRKTTAQ